MSYKTLIALNIMITVAFVGVISAFAQTADTTAPVISGVGASAITQTSAAINWTTDEASDSQVEYGTSTAYGLTTALATATTTAHQVALGSLTASTTYHYLVKSKDIAGNLATSSDFTFITLAQAATTTPPTATSTVAVKVKVEPKTLNAKSTGKWIEAEVKFPRGTDIRTLDLASIKLNNALAPVKVKTSKVKWYEVLNISKKEPKVEMKFVRKDLIALLLADTATTTAPTATSTDTVMKPATTVRELTISGTIGGASFSGVAKIRFTAPAVQAAPTVKKEEKRDEKNERHEEKDEKEKNEHRTATSTSAVSPTATTTEQGIGAAPGIIKKEEKKHNEEKREEKKEGKKGNKDR